MPHIVLEYSENCVDKPDVDGLFRSLHHTLMEMEVSPLSAVKSRAVTHKNFRVANGDAVNVFVHLSLSLLPGRSAQLKREVSQEFLDTLKKTFPKTLLDSPYSLSVEIRELDGDSYSKESNL